MRCRNRNSSTIRSPAAPEIIRVNTSEGNNANTPTKKARKLPPSDRVLFRSRASSRSDCRNECRTDRRTWSVRRDSVSGTCCSRPRHCTADCRSWCTLPRFNPIGSAQNRTRLQLTSIVRVLRGELAADAEVGELEDVLGQAEQAGVDQQNAPEVARRPRMHQQPVQEQRDGQHCLKEIRLQESEQGLALRRSGKEEDTAPGRRSLRRRQ